MVRRLVRRFLHWLRQLLTRLSKTKRHPSSSRPLPPAAAPIAAPPQAPSPYRHSPLSPPKPASNRVNNPSNFQMLLGTRQCLPSAAVQDLSQQLAQTDTNTTAARKQRLTAENTIQAPAVPKPAKENTPNSLATEQTISPAPPAAVFYKNGFADTHQQMLESPSKISPPAPQSPLPTSSALSPMAQASPGSITKQGVVKLLFKLKKNNHHGYIAPNDGSKDIIFHQKYIGDRVFGRLEQGMAVEVTAHITEGKAYADSVRIL
ncbi:MAG: cold shock domain-containing protein [Cyanobacteria bacterium P01_A01_bin.137]